MKGCHVFITSCHVFVTFFYVCHVFVTFCHVFFTFDWYINNITYNMVKQFPRLLAG